MPSYHLRFEHWEDDCTCRTHRTCSVPSAKSLGNLLREYPFVGLRNAVRFEDAVHTDGQQGRTCLRCDDTVDDGDGDWCWTWLDTVALLLVASLLGVLYVTGSCMNQSL